MAPYSMQVRMGRVRRVPTGRAEAVRSSREHASGRRRRLGVSHGVRSALGMR